MRRPISGTTLSKRVPTDVLEAEVTRLAHQNIYQHLEKIDKSLEDMAPAVSTKFQSCKLLSSMFVDESA